MKSRYIRASGFFLLTILIVILGYFLFEINKDISKKTQWLDKIYKLKLINTNIDTIISQNTGFYNYDDSKDIVLELNSLLEDIEKNEHLNDFFKSDKDALLHNKLYKDIKNGFEEKKHFIHIFTSTNSILNHSLRFITTLLTETTHIEYQKKLIELHSKLVQIGVGGDSSFEEIERLNSYLKKIVEKKYLSKLILYTSHVDVIIDRFKRLEKLNRDNKELMFDDKLTVFISHLQTHINEHIEMLNNFMLVLVSFIFAVILIIIFLLNSKIEQESKLRTFKHAVENSDNSIIITDVNHTIEYTNEAFQKISGFKKEDILGKTPAVLKSGLLSKEFYDDLAKIISKGEKWSGEFINRDSKGEITYEKATITPILDEDKKIAKFIAIKLDVTADKLHQKEIEEKNMEIEKRYYTDYLTGLGNRNLLMKRLNDLQEGRLFHININNFTQLKTFYGMQNSDKLILEFASCLMELQGEFEHYIELFRVKSDEFCFWCNNNLKNPIEMMQKIHEYIAEREFNIDNTFIKLDITVGACKNTSKENKNRYIEAEIAHHNARNRGLNYMIYEPNNEMENRYISNMKTIKLVQEAIQSDKIIIYFQPIYSAKTNKVFMYEALVRLIDRDSQVLTPDKFLDVAKQTNYYHQIMKLVIRKTFAMSNTHLDKKFSINFSNIDFNSELTLEVLTKELMKAKKPENITIEVLESENISDYQTLKETIDKIKKFGCSVSIDDFGSGHSNYYRLSQLDVDYIKIDGSIIKNLDKDTYSMSVIETIMTFAKKMNYPVVAEYVHSKKILDIIQKYDIEYAQGFYLGKPDVTLVDEIKLGE